jgi:hypothetical protein
MPGVENNMTRTQEIILDGVFMGLMALTGFAIGFKSGKNDIESTPRHDHELNWIYNQGYKEGRVDMYNECQISLDDQYWSINRSILHGEK